MNVLVHPEKKKSDGEEEEEEHFPTVVYICSLRGGRPMITWWSVELHVRLGMLLNNQSLCHAREIILSSTHAMLLYQKCLLQR